MATSSQNKDIPNFNEKNENHQDIKEKQKNEEEKINPLTLLSKDLLEKIDSLEEDDFGEKNNNKKDYIQLDETQKGSDENEDEDDFVLEFEKDNGKENFDFEIFQKNLNEKLKEEKNQKQNSFGGFSQPIPSPRNINSFSKTNFEELNYCFPNGRFSYDYPNNQKKNDSFNLQINNPLQNFFNNSFSMNGKSGWVCAHCKNFNYESKSIFN